MMMVASEDDMTAEVCARTPFRGTLEPGKGTSDYFHWRPLNFGLQTHFLSRLASCAYIPGYNDTLSYG